MNRREFQAKFRTIISLKTKREDESAVLLRACGWGCTSNFPDSCWRWFKTINGERFTTSSADEALKMQKYLTE